MESNQCEICNSRPYELMYLNELVVNCPCGNILKVSRSPAIYIGVVNKRHVCLIPFPGCVVCGRPMNLPWNISIICQSIDERHIHFQEVYHNYGARN